MIDIQLDNACEQGVHILFQRHDLTVQIINILVCKPREAGPEIGSKNIMGKNRNSCVDGIIRIMSVHYVLQTRFLRN
jgi:hypothetical protein